MRKTAVSTALVVVALAAVPGAFAGPDGNKTGQACYEGQYAQYVDPSTGEPFANQGACVSFVAQGGTLAQPDVADLGLSFVEPSAASAFSGYPSSGDVVLHNSSTTLGETYTVEVQVSAGGGLFDQRFAGNCAMLGTSTTYQVAVVCTGTIDPGASATIGSFGAASGAWIQGQASITGAEYPDPNSGNDGTGVFTLGTPG